MPCALNLMPSRKVKKEVTYAYRTTAEGILRSFSHSTS
jgi:hypothetical protein